MCANIYKVASNNTEHNITTTNKVPGNQHNVAIFVPDNLICSKECSCCSFGYV